MSIVPRFTPGADPQWTYPVQDTTYRAHDAIKVRIHDLSRVGAVLDTALGSLLASGRSGTAPSAVLPQRRAPPALE